MRRFWQTSHYAPLIARLCETADAAPPECYADAASNFFFGNPHRMTTDCWDTNPGLLRDDQEPKDFLERCIPTDEFGTGCYCESNPPTVIEMGVLTLLTKTVMTAGMTFLVIVVLSIW